jgi:hypothetical protein
LPGAVSAGDFHIALYSDDVLCLRTFLALSYSELNALAFGQGFEA